MSMDRSRYPIDWESISWRIRSERACWRCEKCGAENGNPHPVTGSKVMLTVAHLGIDKPDGSPGDKRDTMDCRPENLLALCQRCHLNFDRADHLATQAANRAAKAERERIAAGQMNLFDAIPQPTNFEVTDPDISQWLEHKA